MGHLPPNRMTSEPSAANLACMIHPIPCTIGDLLTQPYTFEIPRYQRDYSWQREEVGELIDDLIGSDNSLYLGTMIFDASDKGRAGSVAVVDGQQRFTTIFLMLIACRTAAKRLTFSQIEAQTQSRIAFVDPATGDTRGTRLKTSSSIRDVFTLMADSTWNESFPLKIGKKHVRLQVRALKPAYQLISDTLDIQSKEKLSKVLAAIYRISIIRIDVDAEEEAFSIFERTNARGVDLEVEDLLKNFLYQKGVPDLNKKWNEIIANADGTALRMLKYFYVARNGAVSKVDLYKRLKLYSNTIGSTELLVEQLVDFSRFFALARREQGTDALIKYFQELGWYAISTVAERTDRLQFSLQALRLFKVTQAIPLLYAAILCIQRLEEFSQQGAAKHFVRLAENLENYHFINSAVGEGQTNKIEGIYAKYCIEFNASNLFEKTANSLLTELQGVCLTASQFSEKFSQLGYSPQNLGLLAYIFDRICNAGRPPGQRVTIFNPNLNLTKRNHNIEHFAAQNPKEGEPRSEIVDSIGNLLAICLRVNSSLQNDSPETKLKRLRGELSDKIENLGYVNDFLSTYEKRLEDGKAWDDTAIKERTEQMAQEAYTKVWKFPGAI